MRLLRAFLVLSLLLLPQMANAETLMMATTTSTQDTGLLEYLQPIFKKDTGSSLINYIIDRRIAHSKELLAKGEMSIRDIAITCGFQNISYFSRQFKKSTGMTPRQFKN